MSFLLEDPAWPSSAGFLFSLSKETVARELASIGFARTGFERDDGRMDLSEVTGSHTAILQAKRQSLMDLAKLFGWVVEKREDVSFEERLTTMTPEQRRELAVDMAVRLKEQVARYREIEAKGQEVPPDESENPGNDLDRPRD